MLKFTRACVKVFWWLTAFLLISLAVVVAIGRELTPKIADYKPQVEAYIADNLGVTVELGELRASWEGLSPELRVSNVRFSNDDGKEMLAMGRARLEVSLLRTLFNWRLAWTRLAVDGAEIGLRQNPDRSWSLVGQDPDSWQDDSLQIDDPLDILLLGRLIELTDAHFRFEFVTGHVSEVALPQLTMENRGNFHRIESHVRVDENRDALTFILEGRGDPRNSARFNARGYLHLQDFELDKALAALPGNWWDGLPNKEWRQGHQLNLESWFDIRPGMELVSRGTVEVGDIPLAIQQGLRTPTRTGARFVSRWQASGAWSVDLHGLQLSWDDVHSPATDIKIASANLGQPVQIQTGSLDLGIWHETLEQSGNLDGELAQALNRLTPRGRLRNLLITVERPALAGIRIRSELEGVSVGSWYGAPALEGINGYLDTTPFKGHIDLDTDQRFSMFYPTVYREPQVLNSARGRVDWQVDPGSLDTYVHSGLLTVMLGDSEANGYFSLSLPGGNEEEGELTIQVGMRNGHPSQHNLLVPYTVPESLLEWLDESIVGESSEGGKGRVRSGGFIYRGGLTYSNVWRTSVQLYLDVEDAELAYSPDWPTARDIDAELWLNDTDVTANVNHARLLDSETRDTRVGVTYDESQDTLFLSVQGRMRGGAEDGLIFLTDTPIREWVGSRFDTWQLGGGLVTDVDLQVPLEGDLDDDRFAGRSHQRVEVQLKDARLALPERGLSVSNIHGRVHYDDRRGLSADSLEGQVLGYPLRATIRSGAGTRDSAESLLVNLEGRMSVATLRDTYALPELGFVEGDTRYSARITVPTGAADSGDPHFSLFSNLKGIAVDLPAPFGKTADASSSLNVSLPLSDGLETTVEIRYGSQLHSLVNTREDALQWVSVGLGQEASPVSVTPLTVAGKLTEFDFDHWQQWLEDWQAGQPQGAVTADTLMADLRPQLDILVEQFVFADYPVDNLHLQAERHQLGWQLALDSTTIAGDLTLYDNESRPMAVDLARLDLQMGDTRPRHPFLPPPPKSEEDPLKDIDPRSLPAMDVRVAQVRLNGDDFGSWSFTMNPVPGGTHLTHVNGNIRSGRIMGQGDDSGASLWWEVENGESRSRFEGRFVSNDLGAVLQAWDQPRSIDSESSAFDASLSWPGTPASVSTVAISGGIDLLMEQGSFNQEEGAQSAGGAFLQLVSFFNFDTWMRRLRLDFSDLSSSGMAFDKVEGHLDFAQGRVTLHNPMVVESTSAKFQVTGLVDLNDEQVDASLVATLPVGGNLTLFTAVAAGLPAALGVYVISKVFEEQMNKVASVRYEVEGSLDDPVFKFDRLFSDDTSRPVPSNNGDTDTGGDTAQVDDAN